MSPLPRLFRGENISRREGISSDVSGKGSNWKNQPPVLVYAKGIRRGDGFVPRTQGKMDHQKLL